MDLRQEIIERVYAMKRSMHRRRSRARRGRERKLFDGRVVVGMNAGIGNAVEATPLVQALRTLWERAYITVVAPPGDLFSDWCVPDRVVSSWGEISGDDIDHTFLAWYSSMPEGVPGEIHKAMGAFQDYLLRPEREINLDLARIQGFAGAPPPLYVTMRRPAEPPPDAALRIGIAAGGNAGHRWRNKRWPYYAELIEKLLARHEGVQLCVIGTSTDFDVGEVPRDDRVHDLRDRYSLAETAWMLRHCDLVIGNDCGPMHVADAVLAPTLVLFGPTCEIKNGPRNRGETMNSDAACSPCQYDLKLLDTCDNPVCMTGLPADLVVERAEKIIAAER